MSQQTPFRRIGTGVLQCFNLQAATCGNTPIFGTVYHLQSPYSNWALHVQLSGAGTSGTVQLLGAVATSSQITVGRSTNSSGSFVALTTWDGAVNTAEDYVFASAKPVSAITAGVSLASSSCTFFNVWITGTA